MNKVDKGKLTVCHCLISGNYGGIERLVDTLVEEQCKHSLTGVAFGLGRGPFFDSIAARGIPTCFLGLRNGFDLNPRSLVRLIRFFRKYDVVHIHGFNYLFLVAAFVARKKVVYTFHGLTLLRRKLNWRDRLKFWTLDFGIGLGTIKLTAVSIFMMKVVQEYFKHATHVTVVPNCVGAMPEIRQDRFVLRKELGIRNSDFVVLTYCRMVHNKRVDILINALKILNDQGRAGKIRCLILGEGPSRPCLADAAKDAKLEDIVRFIGFKDKIQDYIEMADLCVFPFKDEAFGLTVLETLSKGKIPIVFRDGGGTFEIMKSFDDQGLVVDDADELAQIIYKFSSDPELLEPFVEPCRELAATYSPQATANGYLEIYRRCVIE